MFEPEKEIEATNKRIDRLTEYTSLHADLLNGLVSRVYELERQNQTLSEALLESTFYLAGEIKTSMLDSSRGTLKYLKYSEKGNKKEYRRQMVRELELLKSQVDYLNDKIFEKRSDPLKRSEKL